MGKIQRLALFAIAGLIVLYVCDYAVARVRPAGSVDVQIMWAIKQKDNRIDYELGDTETRPCVHSLLPHMGYAPCWYLAGHRNQTITVSSLMGKRHRSLAVAAQQGASPRKRVWTIRGTPLPADFSTTCAGRPVAPPI